MNLKKSLVFLGMMGSGKSSIGYLVSKKLNLEFKDIDNLIEIEEKMNVSKIFEVKGESYFRDLEEKITLNSLDSDNIVISLGGGGFINKKIRKKVLTNHLSFWLNWDEKIILSRIKGSKKRPLAFKSSDQDIKKIIRERSKIYSTAKYKINCNKLAKNEIVKKVIKIYELN